MPDFTGRVVLVTGASGGLGRAVVDAFLAGGATVAAVARFAGQPSDRLHWLSADLTDPGGAQSAATGACALRDRIDALIHVVGGFAMDGPVEVTTDATWDHMMNVNLRAAFLTFRAVLPYMRQSGYGRIVAVGSRAGLEPGAGLSAYNVSKAGLISLVRTVAAETRGTGITANVILPSIIDTPANRAAMPGADAAKWVKPESIARALVWLASEEAGDTSGAAIPIYGGA